MMRCLAGICGGGGDPEAAAGGAVQLSEGAQVVKPTIRLDEEAAPAVLSFAELVDRHDKLMTAPPNAVAPSAVVSSDFTQNCARLLVLVPSIGAPEGSWDTAATGGRGEALPVVRWAQANGYAVCLFRAASLAAAPGEVWDRVMKGSPASSVIVLAAAGALELIGRALAPLHPLLLTRYRLVAAPFQGAAAPWPPAWPAETPAEIREVLQQIAVKAPAAWATEDPLLALQHVFELLALREARFQKGEARKYAGFQDLKENDMPGLKRLNADERIKRLDRDRGNDELARLVRKNEKAGDRDDEPDID